MPRDSGCSCLTGLQHTVDPCYYVQPCTADDFYAGGSRLNISDVFWTLRSFGVVWPRPARPPYPIVAPDFLYFVGKNNTHVYFSLLIRQWCSLGPAHPLLWDGGDIKHVCLAGSGLLRKTRLWVCVRPQTQIWVLLPNNAATNYSYSQWLVSYFLG